MAYNEEDFLQLSGLQHFRFCRRQWALIHIEHQWAENYRTIDGAILHENAHDTDLQERRGDRFITRGVSVYSAELGVSGQCDVLEYHRGSVGIPLSGTVAAVPGGVQAGPPPRGHWRHPAAMRAGHVPGVHALLRHP